MLSAASVIHGCGIDFENPNAATEEVVLSTKDGIFGLTVGMQQYYATSVVSALILTTGTTSREIAINTTFANLVELELGGTNLLNNNGNVSGYWSTMYRVLTMTDQILEHAPSVAMDNATRSGIIGLAHYYKAAALGHLVQVFEQAAIATDPGGTATFRSRAEVLAEAIRLLDLGLLAITTTPPSTEFRTRVLGTGFDLQNSINALRARYLLYAGRHQDAINAASAVVPTVKSTYAYNDLNRNPVYTAVFVSSSYAPRDNFGTPLTEAGDKRIAFYLAPNTAVSRPNNYPIERLVGFFAAPTQAIPVYLPGEMNLIKAEAYVRLGNLPGAVLEINAIRTKTAAQDAFGVGADLPIYTGAVTVDGLLTEIYRQRSAELFLTGLRFEDSRRMGRPGPPDLTERNRTFYPYPNQERVNNPNTPGDPAI